MAVRQNTRSNSGRTLADASELSSLGRLIDALGAEKTRFIVVGMTGAVLQGTPVTTFDVDLWIDLPPRQYMRIYASKKFAGRPKDFAHLPILEQTMRLQRRMRQSGKK